MSDFDPTQPGYDTQAIIEKDKAHHVHPWQVFDVFRDEGALPIVKGEGSYIFDSEGRKYFDAVGGLWCNNIGLGRKEMAEAIAAQAYQLSYASPFVDLTNIPAAELAAKLASLAPATLNHVFFTCGGSTAVDTAFRMIHYYQNCRGKHAKKHIISRINSYHGTTYASMSIGGKPGDHPPEFDFISDTIHHLSYPNYYRCAAEGMSESEFVDTLVQEFEDKIEELGGADNVAAFFAEPIMGAGGVIVAPEGYLKRMHAVCKANDILYVSDEVVTAFGRLGHWFASEDEFGIVPDMITSAKGLTSGYQPLGALLFSDEIWDVLNAENSGRCFAHGFTYSGHPVACAAALKNIEIMEREQLLENVKEVGPYFEQQLKTLEDLPIVGQVRGRKFMVCVEYVADKKTKALFPEELDIGKRVSNNADELGLITRAIVHLNVMSPPLTMNKDEVDFIVATLRQAIEATIAELRDEGHFQG
ncbi:aminotransferase [Aestuariicella hydrocarbonica]|uniref:Aminotransferase n=1 Tax=Pseudomaricurvus hydrocarbonicus TaxID=1470433 RepID=A0A9E5T4B1_9GAMM|nr:aminotransferase [Aestuariicella hydrocarbonica]NHO67759.1 aminotransferase [Aestuariicella hydrocarbonica]